ncbi:MAG: DNA methyltransferase [Nitrososphaerota archaeon]|nr:DNA methyltransferase [Candidatus Calditenuaceae archaeon]MDW8073919.1 DNA methyltransferase [Nitrososphaerota archaeon]
MCRRVLTSFELPTHNAGREIKDMIDNLKRIEASTHTPVYMMHKFWARRPWKVFRTLIETFTNEGDVILDPFAGGGVTLVEGLIARRKVIAVDLNPLAVKIMYHEVAPLDIREYRGALSSLKEKLSRLMDELYAVKCPLCNWQGVAEWVEYDRKTGEALIVQFKCPKGHRGRKKPEPIDLPRPPRINLSNRVKIPAGDKTSELLESGYKYFDELYTPRNLAAIHYLREAINSCKTSEEVKSFLQFTLSSTLKWASKMSHRRGKIIEGWAMHAYWIYPRYLEINVWHQFLRRANAIIRGKEYTNKYINGYAVRGESFDELKRGKATYMILNTDSRKLPIPDGEVEAIITDPPYGGNVNYAELSDYFLWLDSELSPKNSEIVINKTRGFTLEHYRKGLATVFRECHRVLRENGLFISTFNSKDLRVVAAFLSALKTSGFDYIGVSYQPYLKGYETTFHAMQVDALPFDFIFFFEKSDSNKSGNEAVIDSHVLLKEVRLMLSQEMERCIKEELTEKDYRVRTYPAMISALNSLDSSSSRLIAHYYEDIIKKNEGYFSKMRNKIIEIRRNNSKNNR